ncbi:DNA cytosine methyltransferase [Leisingera sp. M523]|uniref:DNA cytosine methyltransferase n=1 Tax=Leisingera sp. M523 TaxID=2867013 RepID=UPI0021A3B72B|nr:DNA cytosine methyltransferase [Leisingera sp. M523]UWQ28861.1 DNA cytosine methyltransferase [Leisingera sp. M523]
MDKNEQLIQEVRAKIEKLGLGDAEAAKAIGVTPATLNRHLSFEYVRSDSVAKYRRWLVGDELRSESLLTYDDGREEIVDDVSVDEVPTELLTGPSTKPAQPLRVIDLFAGCGGLSLGFELADSGELYKTVMAIDIEEAMVRVFNDNHPRSEFGSKIGRQADLSEFLNEAEVLAYYLDHLASVENDTQLAEELDRLEPLGLGSFIQNIQELDREFIERLTKIRDSAPYQDQYALVEKTSLSQTSVLGFHNALKLPQPGRGKPSFKVPLWGETRRECSVSYRSTLSVTNTQKRECVARAETLWRQEIDTLRGRVTGSGSGQLASAARKIQNALTLIESEAYASVKEAWCEWWGSREAIRRTLFEDEHFLGQLQRIYRSGRQVHVLLGGPPCQGFSRIGRGKIRSLREQSVHVQSDTKAGDKRNELMHQYVLFVAALEPAAFLFENVRHFQAKVKTPEGTYNATDVLAEAISNISHEGLMYEVNSEVLVASNHLVPQKRERFFMLGVRCDVAEKSEHASPSSWSLNLPTREAVPLKFALAGLPEPVSGTLREEKSRGTDTLLNVQDVHINHDGAPGEYLEWIRRLPSKEGRSKNNSLVDAHCARASRRDDSEFFEMMGPGKRWMDYRCDGNPLVEDLASLVEWLLSNHNGPELAGLTRNRIGQLKDALNGSLSLRLLLDRIRLGAGEEKHHLCAPNYLKKREGNHGDWLARMDPEVPSKTMTSHMGKDTYAYIHPSSPRTISVREAARIQTFPDWYRFGSVGLVDGFRVIGNAVPPLLSTQLALRVGIVLEMGGAFELSSTSIERVTEPPAAKAEACSAPA